MLNFDFYSPTYFAFGRDTESRVGELTKRFGGTKALVHYGQGSVIRSGLLDKVRNSLTEAGIEFVELGGVVPNPRATLVYEGIELCRREKVDFVLGIGGGSSVDSAKAIAIGVPYEGDFWKFYCGQDQPKTALPIGSIVTLAATGTEGSNSSVISNDLMGNLKCGVNSDLIRPTFSILNPELTYTVPDYHTSCGATDILSHIIERYFTNTEEVELTDLMSEAVFTRVMSAAKEALRNPEDYEARADLLWGGTLAHNNILGVGREQDWSSHRLEHALSSEFDVAHGAGLAVIVPNFMLYTINQCPARFARFAVKMFGLSATGKSDLELGKEGIKAFRAFLDEIKMPKTLADLGISREHIPRLQKAVVPNNGDLVGYFQPLDKDDVIKIFELSL
ncbi:MAG TPA: iron-containing alcohol dehydrogenase [Clostridiaceae bacterium]|nr:iron-containing alcohol dehydrogenase [Clostridiaceae bacterium]